MYFTRRNMTQQISSRLFHEQTLSDRMKSGSALMSKYLRNLAGFMLESAFDADTWNCTHNKAN